MADGNGHASPEPQADAEPEPEPRASTAEEPSEERDFGTFSARLVMYVLQGLFVIVFKTVRAGIPMMTPLIAADLGLSDAENAMVLSGFCAPPAPWLPCSSSS